MYSATVLAAVTGLGALLPTISAAQTTDSAAIEASNTSGVLSEVIVTAQHRGERLMSVPMAIRATTGDELQARRISSVEDLAQVIPDLRIASPQPAAAPNINMRGIGPANNFNSNNNMPVGIYMDEVYQAFQPSPTVQLFDLDRVEVLKGPQGTLYGHSTTGGAINFISRQPRLSSDDLNGNLSLGYGNYDLMEAQGAADLTLVDGVLGVRVAGFISSRDGYLKTNGRPKPGYPRAFNANNVKNARVIFKYQPDDSFNAVLSLYSNLQTGNLGPITYGVIQPGNRNVAGFSRDGLDRDVYAGEYIGDLRARGQQGTLTLNWLAGAWKVTSISSLGEGSAFFPQDCDGSPFEICARGQRTEGEQYSQDLRAAYASEALKLTLGAIYSADDFHNEDHIDFGGVFPSNRYTQKRRSYAAYADGTYAFDERVELTLGARVTRDKTTISKVETSLLSSFFGTPVFSLVPGPGPYVPGAYLPTRSESSTGLTGRAILTYKFAPDIMAYASASHGYRAGAFNGLQTQAADLTFVGPEKADNFELGGKASLLDRRVQVTGAVFYTKITNQQLLTQINIPATPTTPGQSFSGLAGLDGRVYGLEFQVVAAISHALRTHFDMTLLDTRYADGQVINGGDVGGRRFPFAPKMSAQLGVDWTLWEEGDRKLTAGANVSYSSQFYFDPNNGEQGVGKYFKDGQKAYALVDARLGYDFGRISVSIWGRNVFDKYYSTYVTQSEAAFGSDFTVPGLPRTFGATVSATF